MSRAAATSSTTESTLICLSMDILVPHLISLMWLEDVIASSS